LVSGGGGWLTRPGCRVIARARPKPKPREVARLAQKRKARSFPAGMFFSI